MKHRVVLAAATTFALTLTAVTAQGQERGVAAGVDAVGRRALVIGINEYARPQWKLRGAVADARNIETFLKGSLAYKPEQIRLLLDQDATRANILKTFEDWLINGSKPGDELFFYYSGHGSQQKDEDGDEEDGLDETLVSADASPDGHGGIRNMITDDEIGALLDRVTDRKVTVVVDACHSGTVTRGLLPEGIEGGKNLPSIPEVNPPEPVSTRAVQAHRKEPGFTDAKSNLTVWTAVAPYQVALEEVKAKPITGVFTNRFIRGVAQKQADLNGDGVVSHAELHEFLQRESDAYCQSFPACQAGLTPTLEGSRAILPLAVAAGSAATLISGTVQPKPQPAAKPDKPKPQDTATALLSHPNPANVTVEVLPGDSVRLGQPVRFRVQSGMDGHLLVLDVNAAGALTQIFPNKLSQQQSKDGRIAADRPLTIPDATYGFEFTASEPAGEGLLIALVIQDPVQLADILGRQGNLEPVARAEDYLSQIAERLRKPWTGDAVTRASRWSMASRKYTITRR